MPKLEMSVVDSLRHPVLHAEVHVCGFMPPTLTPQTNLQLWRTCLMKAQKQVVPGGCVWEVEVDQVYLQEHGQKQDVTTIPE